MAGLNRVIEKTTAVGLTKRIRLASTTWWDPVVRGPGINYTKREKASSKYDTKQCKKCTSDDKKREKTPKLKFLPRTHK